MTTWLLPSARPISCKDCPAFQRFHISVRWAAESFHRLACFMNTTFRGKIYTRWCCIDRLSRHDLSRVGSAHGEGCSDLRVKNAIRARPSLPCAIVIVGVLQCGVCVWGT